MTHDSRRWTGRYDAPAPPPKHRRRWTPPALAFAMTWPLAVALLVTAMGIEPDAGMVVLAFLNAFPAVGLSPFARGTVLEPVGRGHDEFERAALAAATGRALRALLLLLLALALAAALATANGALVAPGPMAWLFWAATMLTLFGTLPVYLAERAVPLPAPSEDAQP